MCQVNDSLFLPFQFVVQYISRRPHPELEFPQQWTRVVRILKNMRPMCNEHLYSRGVYSVGQSGTIQFPAHCIHQMHRREL